MKAKQFLKSLLFLFVINTHAQTEISGKIVEATNNGIPIPNAVLMTNQQRYFFSDIAGEFSVSLEDGEKIQRIIAKDHEPMQNLKKFSVVKMNLLNSKSKKTIPKDYLNEISVNQLVETNFSFKSLSITTITNSDIDFVLKKDIDFRLTIKKGLQQNYKAIGVDGIDEVVPKMVNRDVFSFNWFQNFIEVFDQTFLSPFNRLNSINYRFYQIHESDEVKIIAFEPLKKGFQRSLQGVLLLDKKTSKFKTIKAILDADFRMDIITNFDLETGLPKQTTLNLEPGEGGTKLSFFGGGMAFGRIQNKNPKEVSKLEHRQVYYGLAASDTISPFPKSLSKTLEDKDQKIPVEYWSQFNFSFIDEDSKNVDALEKYIEEENIKTRVKRISAFDAGYFPIGMLDVDLTRLIKANNYEGLRLGLGVQTNQSFSEKYRFGAFTAYGTQDVNFKYGVNAGVILNPDTSTWFNAFYDNDIEEVGMNNYLTDQRVYSLFEPRLVNISFFYKYKKYGLSLQHNFTPQLMSELKLEKNRVSQTRDYAYVKDGDLFTNYDLTTATFGLRWTPNYTYSKVGKRIYVNDAFTPEISAQVCQSLEGALGGDFSFTKVSTKIDYDIQHSWGSLSSVELGGDFGFGDIPLMHTFHAFPNSPNKENILNRFSVAGVKSFETMYFNEFFSTKLATLHLKHRLAPFKLTNTIQPELVLISRHAVGDFDNPEHHQNIEFNTLTKGYHEAGFELNKLLFGFGLSFAYRYGAYQLPELEDNISLKFTFYLKL